MRNERCWHTGCRPDRCLRVPLARRLHVGMRRLRVRIADRWWGVTATRAYDRLLGRHAVWVQCLVLRPLCWVAGHEYSRIKHPDEQGWCDWCGKHRPGERHSCVPREYAWWLTQGDRDDQL
jgi:hypothetical protein